MNRLFDLLHQALECLIDILAERIAEKLADRTGAQSIGDPCLTLANAAKRMGLSETTVRTLVKDGKLKTVPGLTEKRVKQSTADNYGK